MGREVRMVPPGWEHPKGDDGRFKPLHNGYKEAKEGFLKTLAEEGLQAAIEEYGCPDQEDYMPDWSDDEATHLMMYENVTEGTPISPAFATPEELAKWLADNKASAFAGMTATYEQWLSTCKRGFALSACVSGGELKSGVAAEHEIDKTR